MYVFYYIKQKVFNLNNFLMSIVQTIVLNTHGHIIFFFLSERS